MIGYCGRKWVLYFWFVGWDCLGLGVAVCLSIPHFEIHLPFGFVRFGRRRSESKQEQGWVCYRNCNGLPKREPLRLSLADFEERYRRNPQDFE